MYVFFVRAVCGSVLVGAFCLGAPSVLGQQTQLPSISALPEDLLADHPASRSDQDPLFRPQEAGEAELLSIEQLERMAEAHNPTLVQAARRVQAFQGQQVQVGLYPNPVIGYQAEEVGENGQSGQHGMFLRQEMVTANKLGLNRAVASHEVRQARWDFEIQRGRVVNAVRSRAYEVLATQRTVEITDELVRIGQAAVDSAEKLRKAQEVSQVDVLQARIEAKSAQLQLAAARKRYSAAWRRVAIVVGMPGMEPTALRDNLDENSPDLSWRETAAELVAMSPQIAHARSGVERARCAVARACAGRVPNIETGAAVRYNDDSNDTTVSFLVGVPLMVYDRNQGNIMKANAELAAALREVERIELLLQDRLAEVFRDYEIARQQVEEYRSEILPDAKQSLELTGTGYGQGEFTYLELLTAQQTFARTNLTYIERLRELWGSAVQIDGMLLTGGLDAPGQ